jgi:hypothetical protein
MYPLSAAKNCCCAVKKYGFVANHPGFAGELDVPEDKGDGNSATWC